MMLGFMVFVNDGWGSIPIIRDSILFCDVILFLTELLNPSDIQFPSKQEKAKAYLKSTVYVHFKNQNY